MTYNNPKSALIAQKRRK